MRPGPNSGAEPSRAVDDVGERVNGPDGAAAVAAGRRQEDVRRQGQGLPAPVRRLHVQQRGHHRAGGGLHAAGRLRVPGDRGQGVAVPAGDDAAGAKRHGQHALGRHLLHAQYLLRGQLEERGRLGSACRR